MPFDSCEYVRLIQPVEKGGEGGGLLSALARGGGGGADAVPFQPIQSISGGVLSPFGSFNQWGGGGGGAVPFRPIQSVGGGGGGHIC